MTRRGLLIGLLALCAAIFAAPASASAAFVFAAQMSSANNPQLMPAQGTFMISGLDSGITTRVDVRHGAAPPYQTYNSPAGQSMYVSPTIPGLVPGDVIDVRQPQGAATPTESYTIPAAPVTATAGSPTITGTAPLGLLVEATVVDSCGFGMDPSLRLGVSQGTFAATFDQPLRAGAGIVTSLYADNGSRTIFVDFLPGESPCLSATRLADRELAPGSAPEAKPYGFSLSGLSLAVAPDTRIDHVRGTTVLATAESANPSFGEDEVEPAVAGDRYDIYRPKTAPTPTYSISIPQINATFDPTADLVAVDAPATSAIIVSPCRLLGCGQNGQRAQMQPKPEGRSIFNYAKAEFNAPVYDLLASDRVDVTVMTADRTLYYELPATLGDLVAPTQKLSVSSKLKLRSLIKSQKKGLRVKLRSSEAAGANIALTLGKTKLASYKRSVKAGNNTLRLKFTKSGKRALAKLAKRGRKLKSQSAKITVTLTDSSGNASAAVKKLKITR